MADFIAEVSWKCRPGRRWSFSFLSDISTCETIVMRSKASVHERLIAMASSDEVFDTIVQWAFEELPTEYREACKDLTIRTEPLAASEIMSTLQLASPYQLLGLYHGINLAKKSTFDVQILPNEVIIYREAIAAYAAARGYALQDVVRHVLIHEIGHHFGFSDADMEAIERQA